MKWFKVEFSDVFLNGLTTRQVGILVKYRCYCQQFDVEELSVQQFKSFFDWKEREFLVKFLSEKGQLSDNFRTTFGQFWSKNGQLSDNFGVKTDKKRNFLSSKNKELGENPSRADIIYNKDNNIIEKTEERDKTDNISGKPPKKDYAFEGKIIKLNQKDFDDWEKAYPDLNLRAELLQRDKYLQQQPEADQKKWYMTTSQYFIKQNAFRKRQNRENEETPVESFEDYLERSV